MIVQLAERLDLPLRARNQLLLAAGYAPAERIPDLSIPDLSGNALSSDVAERQVR